MIKNAHEEIGYISRNSSQLNDLPAINIDDLPSDAQKLAKMVIQALDAQRLYFKTREHAHLLTSKQLEKLLREFAEVILNSITTIS